MLIPKVYTLNFTYQLYESHIIRDKFSNRENFEDNLAYFKNKVPDYNAGCKVAQFTEFQEMKLATHGRTDPNRFGWQIEVYLHGLERDDPDYWGLEWVPTVIAINSGGAARNCMLKFHASRCLNYNNITTSIENWDTIYYEERLPPVRHPDYCKPADFKGLNWRRCRIFSVRARPAISDLWMEG